MSNSGGREDISRFELYGFQSSGNTVDSSIWFPVARACAPEARRGLRTHTLRLSTRLFGPECWTGAEPAILVSRASVPERPKGTACKAVQSRVQIPPGAPDDKERFIKAFRGVTHAKWTTRMSDVFEGPGYWMASDGKWYPPERHPDSGYRERFVAAAPPLPTMPEPEVLTPPDIPASIVDADEHVEQTTAADFPSVELRREQAPVAPPGLADIHRTGSDASAEGDAAITNPSARSFSVASTDFGSVSERPVFDGAAPRSVTESRGKTSVQRVEVDHGTVELEIDRDPPTNPRVTPLRSASGPALSTSTALALIPSTQAVPGVSIVDRVLAAVLFCAGVAMIVGTFLDWTTGSLVQTGWDRGDGIVTIIAGIFGSASAGPIYVGYHHIVPKTVAIITGLVGLVVVGLTAISVLFDSDAADTSLALGFFVVLAGAVAMTAGGLFHRIDLR